MRYLSSAVALVAAMTFSLAALSQTPQAAKIAIADKAAIRPLSPHVAGTMVPRYMETFIAGFAEINPITCVEINPGMWTVTFNPTFGTTSTRVETGTAAPGQPCAGNTFDFAEIFYTWTTHNNHTTTLGQGPTDFFNATWSTPDGAFNMPFVFNIVVPVVRPKGEMSAFMGWYDSRGTWMPTLIPPDDDPTFDFTNEVIKEVTVKDNKCFGRGIGSMGSTPYSVDSSWQIVNKVMFNQPDIVGWSPCAVEYYRCVKATPPACGYTGTQNMQISSPADTGYTTYSTNTISATIDGFIIPFTKIGIGNVTSQRSTPLDPHPPQSRPGGFTSSDNNCPKVETRRIKPAVLPCSVLPFAE